MAWHVLLIGCPTGGLVGVDEDLALMHGLLCECGIPDASICVLRNATAAAIRAALAKLVADVQADDNVLLYYSGHGLRVDDPDTGESAYAIVPVIPGDAPAGTFHYVLHEELSASLWQISEKPASATWVADCCHATGVFRGEQLRGLAPRSVSFSDHRARLLAELPGLDPEGNPSVVRVCACAKEEFAFGNDKGGYLTQALAAVLEPFKRSALPLANLQALLVARMRRRRQRPVIAGPIERAWLTSRPAADVAFQTLLDRGGRGITGGHALDQRAGDQYIALDGNGVPHLLTLTEVLALRSRAVESDVGAGAPLLAPARLWSAGSPRAAITIDAELPLTDTLALTASGYVVRASESEMPSIAAIGRRAGAYTLCSQRDATVRTYTDFESLHRAVHGLARQAVLLDGATTPPRNRYAIAYDAVSRELVVDNFTGLAFYVTVLALHAAGPIALVNRAQPDGEVVGVAHPYRVQVPTSDLYAVVAIATSLRLDLRGWTDMTASHPPSAHRGDDDWCGVHAFIVGTPGVAPSAV